MRSPSRTGIPGVLGVGAAACGAERGGFLRGRSPSNGRESCRRESDWREPRETYAPPEGVNSPEREPGLRRGAPSRGALAERAGRSPRAGASSRWGRSPRAGRSERTGRSSRARRSSRTGRSLRPKSSPRSPRPPRAGRSSRPERSARAGRSSRDGRVSRDRPSRGPRPRPVLSSRRPSSRRPSLRGAPSRPVLSAPRRPPLPELLPEPVRKGPREDPPSREELPRFGPPDLKGGLDIRPPIPVDRRFIQPSLRALRR